jgi:hypothetical protein
MAADQRREDAGEPSPLEQGPPLPWWANSRIRLPSLLVCLGLAVIALLTSGTHIFSGSGGSANAAGASCVPKTPPLMSLPLSEIERLRNGLRAVMAPIARSRYAWGTVSVEQPWLDDTPQRLAGSRLADGLWPASYEMRSWAANPRLAMRGDDIAADAFMFARPDEAQRFFMQASEVGCHRHGGAWSPLQPPRARDLLWINPDDVLEEDVLLLRGRYVYRIAVVGPQSPPTLPPRPETRAAVATADALACALPDADCRPESRASRSGRRTRAGSPPGRVHSSSSVSSSE